MSAWEITEEDVRNVLDAHNIEYTTERILDYLDELDVDEIVENLMSFSNFDTQVDSMMYDIENFLITKGIVKEEDRTFQEPEENDEDYFDDEDDEDWDEDDDGEDDWLDDDEEE